MAGGNVYLTLGDIDRAYGWSHGTAAGFLDRTKVPPHKTRTGQEVYRLADVIAHYGQHPLYALPGVPASSVMGA